MRSTCAEFIAQPAHQGEAFTHQSKIIFGGKYNATVTFNELRPAGLTGGALWRRNCLWLRSIQLSFEAPIQIEPGPFDVPIKIAALEIAQITSFGRLGPLLEAKIDFRKGCLRPRFMNGRALAQPFSQPSFESISDDRRAHASRQGPSTAKFRCGKNMKNEPFRSGNAKTTLQSTHEFRAPLKRRKPTGSTVALSLL